MTKGTAGWAEAGSGRSRRLESVERLRQIDPHFGPDGNDLDLSGFDVPLYSAPVRGVEVSPAEVGIDPERARELLEQGADKTKDADDEADGPGDGAEDNG
jgi:hypothetical protein